MTRILKLFGRFELSGPEGKSVAASAKLSALLTFLVATGKPVGRDQLTSLLWGTYLEEQARQNFRQALARLRKTLGPEVIRTDDHSVQLAPGAVASDLVEFQSLVNSRSAEDLRRAVTLLDGDLMAGIDLREEAWEEWLSNERRRIGSLACDVLERLGRMELESGRASEALRLAEDCIRRDFFREDAHRLAIGASAALGRKSEAIKHYQHLAERLKQELGTAPESATTAACEQARHNGGVANELQTTTQARRSSIAVLPFANLSTDPEQDYFTDGMVDEIITALSRFHWFFVVARNSSFTYKGRNVDVKQVGRELGVRYVLEGSVRKAGGRVRITGQLIDAAAGTSMWADHFEGELSDIFDLQDQVTAKVVAAIAPKLEEAEIERARHKPTARLDAYDHYLHGLSELYRWDRDANREALKHFYRAIELDRQFASAYGLAARCFSQSKVAGWLEDEDRESAEAEGLARLAIVFGRDDPVALATAGMALAYVACKLDEGLELAERALAINPNFAWAWVFGGWMKAWSGDAESAIERVRRAIALSPNDPYLYGMRRVIALAHFIAGRYELAIEYANADLPSSQALVVALGTVAASAALLGRIDQAQSAMAKLRLIDPKLRGSTLRRWLPLKRDEDFARLAAGLRQAGLPE